jgi:hypothetical protein
MYTCAHVGRATPVFTLLYHDIASNWLVSCVAARCSMYRAPMTFDPLGVRQVLCLEPSRAEAQWIATAAVKQAAHQL